jgi:PAS domain S-box-containing protein
MPEFAPPQLNGFHSVFSHAAVGLAITSLDGRYVYANDAFCKITGYTHEDLLKTDYLSITHPDYQPSNAELSRRLIAEEVPGFVVQKEYVKKDGAVVWVKNSVSLLRDKNGRPTGVVTICEDISERKVIQSALDESEERFRVQFKATPVPIFSWRNIGNDFILVDYNDAADRMTHHGIINLLGRRASELYVATPVVFESMDACFSEQRTIRKTGNFRLISTGEVKHLDVTFVFVSPDRVMIHTEDISERVVAEWARLEAERKFREIFENANEGIFQTTPDGRFLTANPALARILGFDSPEQLIRERTNIPAQHYVNARRREEMKRLLATHGFVQGFELEAYLRDGGRIWLSESIRAVTNATGTVLYYEGICEDITERKRAENELRAQKEILQEIFDHIPVMITLIDRDGRTKLVNQEFERTIGWTQREISQLNVDVLVECYPDEEYRDRVRDFVRTSNGKWLQWRPLTKDGRVIDTSWAVVRLSDGTSIGIGKDITQEKKNARVNAAATTISHGLSGARTPLEAARLITDIADELFGWDACSLQLYDNEKDVVQTVLAIDTINNVRTDVTKSKALRPPTASGRRILRQGAELIVRDTLEFENTSVPFGDVNRPSASIMSVPIRYGDKVIGLLSLHSYQPHIYSGTELNDLKFLADICGEALHRIRAEQSLSESEERFRQMAENMDEVIWMVDPSLEKLLYINPAYEKIWGRSVASVYERVSSFVDSVHPDDLNRVKRMLEARARGQYETTEWRIVRSDDTVRWIRTRAFPIKNSEGVTYRIAGTAEDVTEEKQAEMNLRNYSRRLMEVQETERKHIAQELHDEIGQVLTAVRLNLENLQNSCESTVLINRIKEDIRVIDDALNRVRDLSFELRPSLLDDLGLAAATRWYVNRYTKRAGINADVQIDTDITRDLLSRDVETACFRILQEALTNVARHAKARNVSVILDILNAKLVLSVKDDGIGMEAAAISDKNNHFSTLGLRGMEERALAAAGRLEMISAAAKGTEIRATFPVLHRLDNTLIPSFTDEKAEDHLQR